MDVVNYQASEGSFHLIVYIVVFFLPWSSKGVAYANFISDLLSEVFAEYAELIWLFEMDV